MDTAQGGATPTTKTELRKLARTRRREIPEDRRLRDALALADALSDIPELAGAKLVLAYGANAEEIDPEPALARLRTQGVRIAYPRVTGDALELHEVADPKDLVAGSFAIREPRADAPRVEPSSVDAVLVPAVAFDRRGYRVGYGGGYYDRFLAKLAQGVLRIGVAFDEQMFEAVPHEPHDQPVDIIVTPSATLRATR